MNHVSHKASCLMLHSSYLFDRMTYASSYIRRYLRGYVHNRQIVRIVNLFVNYVVISLLVKLYSLLICNIIHVSTCPRYVSYYVSDNERF